MRIIISTCTAKAPSVRLRAVVLFAVVALVVSACAGADPDADSEGSAAVTTTAVATAATMIDDVAQPAVAGGITVVATTTMLGDIARSVVGDEGTVDVLFPIGADPHDYRPSSAEVAAIHMADLVIANGLGLEEGLLGVLDAAANDGANIVEVADLVNPVTFIERELCQEDEAGDHDDHGDEGHEGEGDHGDHDDHGHGNCDPHVWFDPNRVASIAQVIAVELALIDPSVDWQTRADEYSGAVLDADKIIIEMLAAIPEEHRVLVTNHHSHGYFADRYGFEVIGTVLTGHDHVGEPSSADMARLVDIINETGVPAIFAETTEPTALARAVAAEVDHPVVVVQLYSGSLGEPGSESDTLIGMLKANARLVADALM